MICTTFAKIKACEVFLYFLPAAVVPTNSKSVYFVDLNSKQTCSFVPLPF